MAFLGCERDIGVNSSQIISGYRIEGRVIDRIGNPVVKVDVRVFYNYEFVDYNTPPSKEYTVPSPSPSVTVVVRTRLGVTIRTLYSGNPPPGAFVVEWDQKGPNGDDVPSGTYFVHYLSNGASQKSYSVTVEGTIVVRTDSLGQYTIPDENLPIGYYPVPLYSSSETTFYGNHRISSSVLLLFTTSTRSREVNVTVLKDRVTVFDIVLG
ncbi:MAG: hypothetical protein HY562_06890 [Ignavibacteriales bacterium]|nr:hypothetical protein [Ignavibacteriales bacterium]